MGQTGKTIREQGVQAQLMAIYLLTSPHSNMIGLYWCPVQYMAHETGMTIEGASKGLQRLIECGFCCYDEDTETVWVYEMAKYQVGNKLSPKDNQVKGVQNSYDELPKSPFLEAFHDKYAESFCMTSKRTHDGVSKGFSRGLEGASKGLGSKEKEKEKETDFFDAFWSAYPKKVGKDAAKKAFEKRKPDQDLTNKMIEAVNLQKQSDAWTKDGGQFIPHPATWLNQGRWMDEGGGGQTPSMFAGAI